MDGSDESDLVVPATPAAALEVVQAQAVFQLPVVVPDAAVAPGDPAEL